MALSNVPGLNWSVAASAAGASVLFCMIAVLSVVAARLLRYRGVASPDSPVEPFSLDRYTPMMRLVSEDDLAFLAAQPGYRPEIGRRLRRERRAIFRMYLRALAADFARLHRAARKMVADSPERHSELVGLLIRYQLLFWRRMAMIELRLIVPNTRLPQLDLAPLLRPIELIETRVLQA